MEVNVHQAKTHFSKLLNRVAAGEEVIITRAGKPVARLVPLQVPKKPRPLGLDLGRFQVPATFDDALPAELIKAFEE